VVPVVFLFGSQQITTRRSRLEVFAYGYSSECDGSQSIANLEYRWELFDTYGLLLNNKYRSVSTDPRKFRLPAEVLNANTFYSARVTVLQTISLEASSLTASIFVAQSAVVPVVSGGNERSLRIGDTITLDALGSFMMRTPGLMLA
jgi:hypothetical protein